MRLLACLLMAVLLGACSDEQKVKVLDLGTVEGCDVARQSCSATRDGMIVDLTLGPEVIPLEPFTVRLQLDGDMLTQDESVTVDFQMEGMDMGLNRYRMRQEGEHWLATATLPVCTASRMDWYAEVEFAARGERYTLRFPFVVEAN